MKVYYKKLTMPDGSKQDEHRYIIEQHLGRKLMRNEVVHHINGNIKDNRLGNLQVMSLSEHARLHQIGKSLTDSQKEKLRAYRLGKPFYATAKYTSADAEAVRRLYADGLAERRIEAITGINRRSVHGMIYGTVLCYRI